MNVLAGGGRTRNTDNSWRASGFMYFTLLAIEAPGYVRIPGMNAPASKLMVSPASGMNDGLRGPTGIEWVRSDEEISVEISTTSSSLQESFSS